MRALACAAMAAALLAAWAAGALAAPVNWGLVDKLDCRGHTIGKQSVKVSCTAEETRGNRIYTTTIGLTVRGPVAKFYVGKHEGCRHIEAAETRFKKDIITCPGVPVWWKR